MSSGSDPESAGWAIIVWSWRGTAVFAVTAIGATVVDDLRWLAALVALTLFGVGCIVFLAAFGVAVERSGAEACGIGGFSFLAGSSPRSVRRHLLGSLGVEVVVGLATASIRVFTSLALGTLVPVFGLAMAGLWGARHGAFGPRG